MKSLAIAVGALVAVSVITVVQLGGGSQASVPDPSLLGEQAGATVISHTLPDLWEIEPSNLDPAREGPQGVGDSGVLSPDGRRIAFSMEQSERDADIFVIDADGGRLTDLTRNPDAIERHPCWSPNGTRLAYDALDRGRGDSEIMAMNADGTGMTNLTNHPADDGRPAWSPDAKHIAFMSGRAGVTWGIWVMDADGANPYRVAGEMWGAENPSWSPDGRRLLFESTDGSDRPQLYSVNVDGTGLTRLTDGPADHLAAVWRR